MAKLTRYNWPGNVRELENVVERAMILARDTSLELTETLETPARQESAVGDKQSLEEVNRAHILAVLQQCNWKIKGPGQAAERLGVPPSTLRIG